jgi:hypothetical protein
MGGILTLPIFLAQFPSINPDLEGLTATESAQASTYQGKQLVPLN